MAVEKLITQHIDTWTSALQTRSTAGRGSNGKIDLYGIKKLRELILELAVRGNLVPQDPNDEPASELLKRISAEKAELVKQGKIKKQKPLSEISEDEKPFELPKGWECARLGNTVAIIRGITFPANEKHREPSEGKVACLRTANVQDNIEWDDLLYVSKSFVKRSEQFAEKGDIVMSMANSRELVGKVAYIYNLPTGEATFGGFLSVIRPYGVNASYLMSVLRSPNIKSILIDSSSQTTNIANISLEKLNPLVILVPPIGEQNRIVSKLEELMSLCDQLEQQSLTSLDAHYQLVETLLATLTASQNAEELVENWARISQYFDTLFTTEASIDALKQTILQLAVMGKLVPQDPNDEPASELLKRIEQEKAQLVKEGKIKKQKPLPPVSDEEKPFVLPKGWEWCRLADLVTIKGGKRVSNGYKLRSEPTPHVYIRVADMKDGTVDLSDLKYIDAEMHKKIDKYIITKDDIYMTIVGATIGKCGVIPDVLDGMNLTENAARLIPSPLISRDYLYLCLRSDFCQTQFVDKTMQVGVQKMALIRLANTLIPLPPTYEGLRIKSEVEEINNICSILSTHIIAAQQTQLHLADALTDAALT